MEKCVTAMGTNHDHSAGIRPHLHSRISGTAYGVNSDGNNFAANDQETGWYYYEKTKDIIIATGVCFSGNSGKVSPITIITNSLHIIDWW